MNYYKKEEVENIDQQQWAFIQCNVTDHLMTITLNRPAKKNALTNPDKGSESYLALSAVLQADKSDYPPINKPKHLQNL